MPSRSSKYDSRNAPGSVVASATILADTILSLVRVVSSVWLGE